MSCRFELLDEGVSGRIEICRGCGCIAIHVGPMSMRIDRTGFAHLAGTVRRAHVLLDRERDEDVSEMRDPGYGEIPRGQA